MIIIINVVEAKKKIFNRYQVLIEIYKHSNMLVFRFN